MCIVYIYSVCFNVWFSVCLFVLYFCMFLYILHNTAFRKLMEKRMCMVAFHSLRNAGVAVQDRAMSPVFYLKIRRFLFSSVGIGAWHLRSKGTPECGYGY